jgi:UDP-glucose 4-epimerase
MKKILVTGANSYIGVSFENYLKSFGDRYLVDTLDMLDAGWREKDFSSYDVVYHVAGIAHSDEGKISEEKKKLYYAVNTDLTTETAKKAKQDGVKQFIFMSSAIVYGKSAPLGKRKVVTKDTPVAPENAYSDSKVQAEKGLKELEDESFKIVILRPPMIYGKGSKGNYPTLSKFAKKLPFFPYVQNERSMLYIENLVEFVRLMIDNEEQGIFLPQNKEYVSSVDLIRYIAQLANHKIIFVGIFNPFIQRMGKITYINKVFGNMTIEKSLSEYRHDYNKYSFEDSIRITEEKK